MAYATLLAPCLLAALATAQSTTLIGEWRGDGNPRDTGSRCASTPSACTHGVASDGVRYDDKSVRGGAFYLPRNAEVRIENPLRFVGDFSIEFWFRSSHVSTPVRLLSSAPLTSSSWSIDLNRYLAVTHGTGSGQPAQFRFGNLSAVRWHHVLVTRKFTATNVELRIVLDGQDRGIHQLSARDVRLDSTDLWIPPSGIANRHIDELRLYQGALSRAEALARYRSYAGAVRAFGSNTCTAGSGQRATIALNPIPKPGQTSTLAITGGRNGSIASFILGIDKLATPLPILGCNLLIQPAPIALPQYAWGATTTRNIALRIPNDDCLLGKTVLLQGVVIDPPVGVTLSSGLAITIGV